jgi:hypothetical protein
MDFAHTFFRLKVAYEALESLEMQNEQPSEIEEQPQDPASGIPIMQRIADVLGFSPERTLTDAQPDFHSGLREW